ncbi:MAG TPA: Dabb family protein [Acidobacteriota bacterium]|jgi:hypothetical protein|nr:Dabb family protein [Acidobacteriota bacterium]HRV08172.1 Dabb family protein [Acidobacteriota bacterium]
MHRFIPVGLLVLFSLAFFAASREDRSGTLRHVVAFKFKDSATPRQIDEIVAAFRDLENKIPEIVTLEAGTNVSPEGLHKGFTHCFIVTFHTSADRDLYLDHPAHKAFGQVLQPILEDVFVIDFWAE